MLDPRTQLKKAVTKVVADALKHLSPIKKGMSWYVRSQSTISVVNLQKSQWSDKYYVNLGVSFIENNSQLDILPEFKMDLRIRLERICPPEFRLVSSEIFDLETQMPEDKRLELIKTLTDNTIIPTLVQFSDRLAIQSMYRRGALVSSFVTPEGRNLLKENQ